MPTFQNVYDDLVQSLRDSGVYDFWSIGAGMQYFTDHGLGHCQRVQSKLELFEQAHLGQLNQEQKDILSVAIAVHDVGCVVVRRGHPAISYAGLRGGWGADYFYLSTLGLVSQARDKFAIAIAVANLHSSKPLERLIERVRGGALATNAARELYPLLESVDTTLLDNVHILKLGGLIAFLDSCDNDRGLSVTGIRRTPRGVAEFIEEQVNYVTAESKDILDAIGFSGNPEDLRSGWTFSRPFWIAPRFIDQITFGANNVEVRIDVVNEPRGSLMGNVVPALHSVIIRYLATDLQRCCQACALSSSSFPLFEVRVIDPAAGLDFTCNYQTSLDVFRQRFI